MTMIHMNTMMTDKVDTNVINFYDGSDEPILKIDNTGFYVRGKRLPQDEKEAAIVYNAFHQWLTWATLNRNT